LEAIVPSNATIIREESVRASFVNCRKVSRFQASRKMRAGYYVVEEAEDNR